MEETKLNKEAIASKFEFTSETLTDGGEPVNVEEVSNHNIDELISILSAGEYNPIEFYTRFIEKWGEPDAEYDLVLSNDDEENELVLLTSWDFDNVEIRRKNSHFTPVDIYNIIQAIESQIHFYDLFLTFEDTDNGCCHSSVYGGESFAIHKQWIGDIMTKFRDGEMDMYSYVTISSDFDDMDLEPNGSGKEIRENRLYVKFY